jgi:hypothetical protein
LTAADRVLMLDILFDVHVKLHPDGQRLDVQGPADAVHAAAPALRLHKAELLGYLRATTTNEVTQ